MNAFEAQRAFEEQLRAHARPDASAGQVWRRSTLRMMLYTELVLLDSAAILLGFYIAACTRDGNWLSLAGVNVGVFLLPITLGTALASGTYSLACLRYPVSGVKSIFSAFFFSIFVVLLGSYMLTAELPLSRVQLAEGAVLALTLITMGRLGFRSHVRGATGGKLLDELVIVDGVPLDVAGDTIALDARIINLSPNPRDPQMLHRLGTAVSGFDRVIVACSEEHRAVWALLLKGMNIKGEILVPQFNALGAIGVDAFDGKDTLVVSQGPLNMPNRAKKRALDLAITLPALLALAPLMILVAIAIRLESPGPILFAQDRVGRGNRLFKILKFRSMRQTLCDADGNVSASRDDDRITRVGRFIRKTSIDELPQLLNVLRGDMSVVGPRPHALGSRAANHFFWEIDERYWQRHTLKPGMTGLAQVRGFRGATDRRVDLTNRLQADMEYIDGWDIWRDITILFKTLRVIVHSNAF
ncbi:exopolysaccharide biosynthesis polyprenyl glycosylphosphotransferase [Sphingomonas sp. TDK1]|uniref:exopolysaccharide biosynthesis polyprenyl glycosylphosphotransferase n=1 Tax=Sphingomonas sp. TDK1 TaxID=453247 RepID=UPI0007D98BA4|nr:exopolysaccharide biosynthesis polyprenyl glycosylphosphotransferase [Sphingomonas sp. TDK1]OAN66980.1 sugar transferase [Sphingomonas sp. TDK1]